MQGIWFGSAGLGFVWGWLLVLRGRWAGKRPYRTLITFTLATLLLTLTLWPFGWQSLLAFGLAMPVTLFTHLAWWAQLRRQNPAS